ncbi:MAG: hypothetical protein JWM97_2871 [Phycisphaerales bacterium]|jgi:hypothetical protein|nr:hypothetical protein [Phycisphaerales bacterium]
MKHRRAEGQLLHEHVDSLIVQAGQLVTDGRIIQHGAELLQNRTADVDLNKALFEKA